MSATVFTNTRVITCDAQDTVASALAIDAGRIVAVGDEDSVRSRAAASAEIVDLDGATLLPGLIELYRWLRNEDRLTVRVLCTPEAEPSGVPWTDPLQPEEYLQRLERASHVAVRSDDLFRIDGVTVSALRPLLARFRRHAGVLPGAVRRGNPRPDDGRPREGRPSDGYSSTSTSPNPTRSDASPPSASTSRPPCRSPGAKVS